MRLPLCSAEAAALSSSTALSFNQESMVGAQDTVLRGGVGLQEEKHGGEAGGALKARENTKHLT